VTDENIKRAAIGALIVAWSASVAIATRTHSIPWALVAAWLTFALVVETWPRRDS
jgi:hypothetical protein